MSTVSSEARKAGQTARALSKPRTANPYPPNSAAAKWWREGYEGWTPVTKPEACA